MSQRELLLGEIDLPCAAWMSPNIVLETGAAYGVTSAFIVQALEVNRKGTLISVDLPPLG
jgi:predicted O-methyltransferase YrrM